MPGADTEVTRVVVAVGPSLTGIRLRSVPWVHVVSPIPAGGEIAPALVTQKSVAAADAQAAPIAVGDTRHVSAPAAPVAGTRASPHRPGTQARPDAKSTGGSRSEFKPHNIRIGSFARGLKWVSGCIDDRRGA